MFIQKIIKIFEILNFKDYIILFSVIYVFNYYYKYLTRPNPCPGPLPLPLIGNLHNLGIDVKLFYKECQKKYGDICEVNICGQRCIILSRPNYFEKILSPKIFSPRLPYVQGMDELGLHGHGIAFNDDYESWSYNRQFFTQSILLPKFIETSTKATIQLFEELSQYWQSIGKQVSSNNNNNDWTLEVNFAAWFHGFTNDIVSILITGERTYSLASYYNTQSGIKSEHPDALMEDGNNFVNEIVKLIEGLLIFMFFDKFLRRYIPIIRKMSTSLLKSRDYIFGKLDIMIKQRRKKIEKMPIGEEMKTDMLTSLIIANTEKDTSNISPKDIKTSEPMTDKQIRGNLFDAFAGGTDTTANLFCSITYLVSKHPYVKQKMLAEIDSIYPNSFGKYEISREDLSKLKYCEAIIKETGRLMPLTNFISRQISEDCEVAGHKFDSGTLIHLNVLAAHNDPEYWPNPETFNPDRFYNNQDDKKLEINHAFVIFGGGRRTCPGRKLAMTELILLMALVYRFYNFELVKMHEPLKVVGAFNNCPELKVRISPRILI